MYKCLSIIESYNITYIEVKVLIFQYMFLKFKSEFFKVSYQQVNEVLVMMVFCFSVDVYQRPPGASLAANRA